MKSLPVLLALLSVFFVLAAVVYRPWAKTPDSLPPISRKSDIENLPSFPMDRKLPVLEVARHSLLSGKTRVALIDLVPKAQGGFLVNFWATWCPPCLEELPTLNELSRKLEKKGDPKLPVIIAVLVDEELPQTGALTRLLGFPGAIPMLYNRAGDIARAMGTEKYPETYWIDVEGRVLYKWVGPQDWLSESVLEVLAGRRVGT